MNLEQIVRLVISLQIILATGLLSLGEASAWLPLATVVVLAVSAYVTDLKGWFYLKQPAADLLALAVVIASVIGALQTDRQGLLVVVANLQSYLQYVVLFQRKTPRVYWQLALLSLGQIAISSTLVPNITFGLALLGYLLLTTMGFSLLLLRTEGASLAADAAYQAALASIDEFSTRGPILRGAAAPIEPRAAAQGLLAPAAQIAAWTLLVAVVIFFALPRWNVANLESAGAEPLRTVGFSNTVLLGELGDVVNNPDVVMRVSFFRGRGNRPIQLEGEPLFRGSIVTRYEGRSWSRPSSSSSMMLPTEPKSTIVRQRIALEPLDVGEVFCIFPVFAVDQPDPRLRLNATSDQLIRLEEHRAQALECEVATTGISGNRQRTIVPCQFPPSRSEMLVLQGPPPPDKFAGLTKLAADIVAEQNIDPTQDPAAAARALSDYFHRSGQFFYSLTPQQRQENLDPLEDFVTIHRGGHCEYFAGALVLMLRSVGIPARMAIGFKGGEWNPLGMYYQVQQLHAHAWVEAYLTRDRVPAGLLAREEAPAGAWLVLDPTEGTIEGTAASRRDGLLVRIRQSIDFARVVWINYVASLNPRRQRQVIYEPLAAGVAAGVENLTSREVWLERWQALETSRVGKFWRWYRRHWFSWRGGLVAVGFSLLVVAGIFAARAAARVLREKGWLGKGKGTRHPPELEMYRRLETALARAGMLRHPAQTAHEYAVAAGGELAERVEYRRVAHLPRRVVESFYRVRFGRRTLDNQEARAVEHALGELEATLGRRARR